EMDHKSENMSSGNLDVVESTEVNVANLIDLVGMNEGEECGTWLQIGIRSMANNESSSDES
ncbi:hypothetical protein, partial [Streptococcus anginosus]|uniref:hypothetical protein n=1 Tax=Streptococcus anginosus TaxID=1328 RepID=UPI002ED8646D